MNDVYYMNLALKEAKKAYRKGEIPVGAIIVENNVVIAKGHNLRDSKKNVLKHAEMIAIEKANKKKKDWRLNECIIYITLEPCNMCKGAIEQARIKKVIYGVKSKTEHNMEVLISKIENETLTNECALLLNECFKSIRDK